MKFAFGGHQHWNHFKIIMGQMVEEFDISLWRVDKNVVNNKDGGL